MKTRPIILGLYPSNDHESQATGAWRIRRVHRTGQVEVCYSAAANQPTGENFGHEITAIMPQARWDALKLDFIAIVREAEAINARALDTAPVPPHLTPAVRRS